MEENDAFSATQKELRDELTKLEKGEAELIDIDQLDQELENTFNVGKKRKIQELERTTTVLSLLSPKQA
ncbi:hypothetical protein [Rufibacter sp. XAAS-G3-1]|uniref:hypothetical protein n=1 Tax=Rufibacter sp. XAAS-G3-1 TaxID=2729134 RepID=UPI0015E6B7D3|nr:hypothetical protein [Rufibacter sp. XAAS-G3-1]